MGPARAARRRSLAPRHTAVAASSSRPVRPHSFLELPDAGHLGVIFEQRTADAILEWGDAHARKVA